MSSKNVTAGASGYGPVTVVSASANLIFLSGIGPSLVLDAQGLPNEIDQQIDLTMRHLSAALAAKGLNWQSVVKILVHLTDASEVGPVSARLTDDTKWHPAITIIEVDNLPTRGARLQLDVVAAN